MFENFKSVDLSVGNHSIHGVHAGSGPVLLLLHGYPQTHVMWHKVAPGLAKHFTVVALDLTGYGRSGKPPSDASHTPYSKRAMANDIVNAMQQLGHERFHVAGHDRGGRVAHRMAMDFPSVVRRLAVLDIAPTREMYANTTDAFARAYWHWFFLIQTAPLPENMILADTDAFMYAKCDYAELGPAVFSDEAWQAYLEAFRQSDVVQASCEDYRAAASIDIEHDNEDDNFGRQIACPMLVLWGLNGVIEKCFDPMALWKTRAINVRGEALPGGHYLAEELPELVEQKLAAFFGDFDE